MTWEMSRRRFLRAAALTGAAAWFGKCKGGIPAKDSRQPYLFPKFPGFTADSSFHAALVTGPRL